MSFLWFVLKFFISKSSIVIFIYLKLFIKVSTMTWQNNLSKKKKKRLGKPISHISLYCQFTWSPFKPVFSPVTWSTSDAIFSVDGAPTISGSTVALRTCSAWHWSKSTQPGKSDESPFKPVF